MLQVKSIAEMGAYVSLLEYNGIEGMILLSELSRRRIRSITKLIKVRAEQGREDEVHVEASAGAQMCRCRAPGQWRSATLCWRPGFAAARACP